MLDIILRAPPCFQPPPPCQPANPRHSKLMVLETLFRVSLHQLWEHQVFIVENNFVEISTFGIGIRILALILCSCCHRRRQIFKILPLVVVVHVNICNEEAARIKYATTNYFRNTNPCRSYSRHSPSIWSRYYWF